jgi:ankyrin repeat protein
VQRSKKKLLLKAVESGDARRLRGLLTQGADPNFRTRYGETPLMVALHRSQTEAALILLEARADVTARARDGATALFWAARYGNLAVMQRLLAAGADVSAAREYRDCTPLAVAVSNGHVRMLIAAGADPEQRYLGERLTYFARSDDMRRALVWSPHARTL